MVQDYKETIMKTITTLFIILICSVNCTAQTKVITDYGEEVILFEDGYWKYANDYNQTENIFMKI